MARIPSSHHTLTTGETILVRSAEESDAEALRQCVLQYIESGEGQLWSPGEFHPTIEEEREWVRGLVANPNEILLVAEYQGQIVANIDFHVGKRIRLSHAGEFGMSCLPNWRGRGVGKILLTQMIQWARSNPDIEKVNLRVISNNSRAIGLYQKLGFQEEGRKLKEVKYSDGTYADEIHMGLFV